MIVARPTAVAQQPDFILVGDHLDVLLGGHANAPAGLQGGPRASFAPIVADLGEATFPDSGAAGVGAAPDVDIGPRDIGFPGAAGHHHGPVGRAQVGLGPNPETAPTGSVGGGIVEDFRIHLDVAHPVLARFSERAGHGGLPAGEGSGGGIPARHQIHRPGALVDGVGADVKVAL